MDPVEAGEWLGARPQQFILLTGIDVANRPGHGALLNAMLTRTPDRPPLNMRLINGELVLPTKVAKRTERGILRRDWPEKYTQRVPALIAVFVTLEWDDPSWNERKAEVESKVESVRAAASRSQSRIALVLLQDRSLHGDDSTTGRAAELCAQCQLSPKQLFVLPTQGDLQGYVNKLEAAFHELAQGFYQQKIKLIRARSIPNNSPPLVVRQLFKLGFLSELKQDTHTALRNYKLAYEQCRDHADSWEAADIFEWRSVVGLLNYKMCDLSFLHSTALEAITQMRKHHNSFFNSTPGVYPTPQLASIEYELWKSKQCWSFAELFERAVVGGLTAVATLNPGTHLDAAASHFARANREIAALKGAMAAAGPDPPYPAPDPLVAIPSFFGGRPWRVGVDGLSPANIESDAIKALQLRLRVNHEGVLSLLTGAAGQYKKYGCVNMHKKMMVEMSEEHSRNGDWSRALQHLIFVTRDQLPLPVREALLLKALTAAWIVGEGRAFAATTVASIATDWAVNGGASDRAAAPLQAFGEFLAGRPPPPPVEGLSPALVASGRAAWEKTLSQPLFFSISALPPARKVPQLVSVSACFLPLERLVDDSIFSPSPSSSSFSAATRADAKVGVRLALTLNCAQSMVFPRLRVGVDIGGQRRALDEKSQWEYAAKDVALEPGVQRIFSWMIDLSEQDLPEGCNVVISRVYMEVGSERDRVAGVMEWDGGSLPLAFQGGFPAIRIAPRGPSIVNEGPAVVECLTSEIVCVPLALRNTSNATLKNIKVEFARPPPSSSVGMAILFLDDHKQLQADLAVDVASEIAPGAVVPFTLRLSAQMVGIIDQLPIQATYSSSSPSGGRDSSLIPLVIDSREPFAVTSSLLNINGVPVPTLLNWNSHVVKVDVKANEAIVVTKVEWLLADFLAAHPHPTDCSKLDDDLAAGDVVSYCTVVEARSQASGTPPPEIPSPSPPLAGSDSPPSNGSIGGSLSPPKNLSDKPLGRVCIEWKKRSSPFPAVRSVVPLLSATLLPAPVSLSVALHPAETAPPPGVELAVGNGDGTPFPWKTVNRCSVGSPIGLEYRLHSHHHQVINVVAFVDVPEAFLFAGMRQSQLSILPHDSVVLRVIVIPQSAGRQPFPRLTLRCPSFPDPLLAEANRALPANIFVLPMAKDSDSTEGPLPTVSM